MKRVITVIKTVKPVMLPNKQPVMQQRELTQVFEMDTTLEQLMRYCQRYDCEQIVCIFESEDPQAPHIQDCLRVVSESED